MGCTNSKNDVSELDGIGKGDTSTMTPEEMIKELDTISKQIRELKDKMRPALAEKTGLNLLLEEEQKKLMSLMTTKEEFMRQRANAMEKCWERDADELIKAFKASPTNKDTLVRILTNRTKWQVEAIAAKFEQKSGKGKSLLEAVLNDSSMQSTLGSLLTGSNTQLSQILQFRIMPQPMRDGALLREFSDGLSLMDEPLLEILVTRSNAENRAAIRYYQEFFKKSFVDIVKSKSQGTFGAYKNYKDFMAKVLECRRNEDNQRFEPEKAKELAQELYDARSKVMKDETPFIRIFSTINRPQFESINDAYPGKVLVSDISKCLGAGLCNAVLAMTADKYEFLATRLEGALAKYGSVEQKTVCRILGCSSRVDGTRIRDVYMEKFKRSLDDDLKNAVKQGSYLQALLNLTSGDLPQTPLGSDKELGEDDADNAREGERQKEFVMRSYKEAKTIEKGMAELARQAKASGAGKAKGFGPGGAAGGPGGPGGPGMSRVDNPAAAGPGGGAASAAAALFNTADEDDEQLGIHFDVAWDPVKGRLWKDKNKLANCLDDYRNVFREAQLALERFSDEAKATKEVYFGIVRLCFETEAWHRTLSQQIKALDRFMKAYPKAK